MDEIENVKIRSPWGECETADSLSVVKMTLNQLNKFKADGRHPNPGKLDRDILGYETLIKADVQENATKFLEYKADYRRKGITVDNAQVVEAMKSRGEWKEKSDAQPG